MTKSIASVELNQGAAPAENQLAFFEISDSHTQRTTQHQYVSREKFIGLMLSRQKLVRCDDHLIGLRGLLDPATGDSFLIDETELLEDQTAEHPG